MQKRPLIDHFLPPPVQLPESLLKRQIQWILLSRVLALSILLGVTLLLQSPGQTPIIPPARYFAYFIAAVYGYTILSAVILQRLPRGYNIFAAIQILSDIAFTSLLVFFSGGSQSIFILVFFFPIICSSLLNQPLYRLLLTTATAFAYGCILIMEYSGYQPMLSGELSPPLPLQSPLNALYRFAIPGLTFFLVGFLSSILAERLRKTEAALTETSQSLDRLSILYKQIFNDINTGIITVDHNGRITSFNRAAEEITGYKPHEILNHKLDLKFPGLTPPQPQNWRPMVDLVRQDGGKFQSVIPGQSSIFPMKKGTALSSLFRISVRSRKWKIRYDRLKKWPVSAIWQRALPTNFETRWRPYQGLPRCCRINRRAVRIAD